MKGLKRDVKSLMNVEKMQIFVSRDPKIHKHILILSDLVIIKMNE